MSGTNGSPPRYSVGVSDRIRAELVALAERAAEADPDAGDAVTTAFENILRRLGRDPREAGEPMYHLRGMRMQVRKLAVTPLYIEYGVHDQEPVVVIRRVRWLGGPG